MASQKGKEVASDKSAPTKPPKPSSLRVGSITPRAQPIEDSDISSSPLASPRISLIGPSSSSKIASSHTSSQPADKRLSLAASDLESRLEDANIGDSCDTGVDHVQLHPAEEDQDMVTKPEPQSTTSSIHDNLPTDQEIGSRDGSKTHMGYKTGVLWKLICTDSSKNRVNRYSDKCFEGVEHAEERSKVSVMDVVDSCEGMFDFPPDQRRRRNQSRDLFGTELFEDDAKPFKLGVDFISTSVHPRTVRIMSQDVVDFIKRSLPYSPQALAEKELSIPKPFKILAFTYDSFEKEIENLRSVKSTPNADLTPPCDYPVDGKFILELSVVRDWFKEYYYDKEIAPELSAHEKGFVTYRNLWLLFQPGKYVFMTEDDRTEFYIVESISRRLSSQARTERWSVELWSLDFKGDRLTRRRRPKAVGITEYSGEKEIIKLPIIPLKYMGKEYMGDADGRTPEEFIVRGKLHHQLFCEACKTPRLKQYSGPLGGRKELEYSGAVIVDPLVCAEQARKTPVLGTVANLTAQDKSADFSDPQDNDGGLMYSMLNDIPPSETGPFEGREELYLLLTGMIWGIALGKNQWAQFDVRKFSPPVAPENSQNAFDNLVTNKEDIDLLKAIAATGDVLMKDGPSVSFDQTDFVNGKGVGKVILLYGPPGVGKSFTVECLAQHMGRPLLSLKATDIGTDQSAEQNLSGWLDLAQRWNAVVLLDEADTVLEQRKQHDLNRNALVAAFLHVLEYFPGLIFWTSNLPAWLDDAFISRFHLCIQYHDLTPEMRNKVWLKFIAKLEREETARMEQATKRSEQGKEKVAWPRLKVSPEVMMYVATDPAITDLKLNGRDIRNTFQAASRIAIHRAREESDGVLRTITIGSEDIRNVIRKRKEFQDYLDKVHEGTEERRAWNRHGRLPHSRSGLGDEVSFS
jgi:DNA polymerase III delta prime subunit